MNRKSRNKWNKWKINVLEFRKYIRLKIKKSRFYTLKNRAHMGCAFYRPEPVVVRARMGHWNHAHITTIYLNLKTSNSIIAPSKMAFLRYKNRLKKCQNLKPWEFYPENGFYIMFSKQGLLCSFMGNFTSKFFSLLTHITHEHISIGT